MCSCPLSRLPTRSRHEDESIFETRYFGEYSKIVRVSLYFRRFNWNPLKSAFSILIESNRQLPEERHQVSSPFPPQISLLGEFPSLFTFLSLSRYLIVELFILPDVKLGTFLHLVVSTATLSKFCDQEYYLCDFQSLNQFGWRFSYFGSSRMFLSFVMVITWIVEELRMWYSCC